MKKKRGPGSITVFREVDDPNIRSPYNQPGPSYRYPNSLCIQKKEHNYDGTGKSSRDAYLDMSKGASFAHSAILP